MQKLIFPSCMAARMSFTDTSFSLNPSSSARLSRIPKTTGVMEMDWLCFTRWSTSPMDSQMLLAGQTASYSSAPLSSSRMMSTEPL